MAVIKKYEAKAKVGEYVNSSGETKARWVSCGVVFERENGNLSLKLDCIPIGGDGWINLFPPSADNRTTNGSANNAPSTQASGSEAAAKPNATPDANANNQTDPDDLPF